MTRTTLARHQAIESYLRERIVALQPGALLPTEKELCELFQVSRMTARQAVMRLAEAGLVRREPGRGTFVAAPRLQREIGLLLSFTHDMACQGRTATSRVLERTITEPDPPTRLRLQTAGRILRMRRLRLADEVPLALETVLLPADRFGWLAEVDLTLGSLHAALEQRGIIPSAGDGTLTATTATQEEAHLLCIPMGAPLLVEHLILHDQAGRPIQLGETRYAGNRYALDFHLHRNR